MKRIVLQNEQQLDIDRFKPTSVQSMIEVGEVPGKIHRVEVAINVFHTYTSDLEISLSSPDGTTVVLVSSEGGSGDHFINTIFDDDSTSSIDDASAPFQGSFKPEGELKEFKDNQAQGTWTLNIEDKYYMDGGSLNNWTLTLVVEDEVQSDFSIDVKFMGGLTASQREIVEAAARRWSEIIVGDLPAYMVNGQVVDDLLIEFSGASIDGAGGILGQAGPTHIRPDSYLPIKGIIEFDRGDLARMESDGSLLNVIIHEIAHILGLGTIWEAKNLLIGSGTANPQFIGQNAMREFSELTEFPYPQPVPVANTGGPGTREGHWRETLFGNELMTGYINEGANPLSRLTIASLEDLGHTVNYNAADPYTLPSSMGISMMGIGAEGGYGKRQCAMAGLNLRSTTPIVLSENDKVE